MAANPLKPPPLIAHIVHRLAVGGLENGLVNLINHMPRERYRHAVICLTDSTDFRDRIQRDDVSLIDLLKCEGPDFSMHARLWKVLRSLRPDIVHTRNLSALECLLPASCAGVRGRIHGEHGRDIYDLDGRNFKYNVLRRLIRPMVHRYIAVSAELREWLMHTVGVHPDRVVQIRNGVDFQRFHPRSGPRFSFGPEGFASSTAFLLGTVGRMEPVKDPLTLVRAFLHLLATEPGADQRLRLVMIGDGSLRGEAQELLRAANAQALAWLPGERTDIPDILRGLDLFVLPSLREGLSNTILEAMASGLPVVATRVGGSPELVEEEKTGLLAPPANPLALAQAIRTYLDHPQLMRAHGQTGRKTAEQDFSMEKMVHGYIEVYESVLNHSCPK